MEAALKAGAVPVGVTNGIYSAEQLQGAAIVLRGFDEEQRRLLVSFIAKW